MKVREISVTGLFGMFDHTIPLSNSDRVTIIHGPNGLGKTMMLKMISALIDGRSKIFERVPFEEFTAKLEDGSAIVVRHKKKKDFDSNQNKIEIFFREKSGSSKRITREDTNQEIPRHVLDSIDRFIPGPYSRRGSGWRDDMGGFYTLEDILDRFPFASEHVPRKYRQSPFTNAFRDIGAFFVETTRLNAEAGASHRFPTRHSAYEDSFHLQEESSNNQYGLRVDQYSKDIVQRIKSALADYAKHSQEKDRTFPERLVRFIRDREYTQQPIDLLKRMSELESKRQRLISLGFLDSETGLKDLNEDDVKRAPEALTIYVGDVQEKLAVFDDLSQRVGKMIDIVNERFRYKSLTLNRDQGFKLKSKTGDTIQLEDLSSGEQHELVVLYELLFRAPRNGLILVDEPEISLHVAWQSRFLTDLMDILRLTDSYGIVATHSPVIIGTRWDLTQELKGPSDEYTGEKE